LDEFIATGIPIHARISGELLINIFIPNTPLHDGAVIVKDHTIAAASAYLPLTDSKISKEFGTRHRAAIGLSEATDALTIVVSEETGAISITKNREFLPGLTMEQFGKVLRVELIEPPQQKKNLLQLVNKNLLRRKKDG
jgi:diadenylate cyclase